MIAHRVLSPRPIAVLLLALGAVPMFREAIEHDDLVIGLALWAVYVSVAVVCGVLIAGAIVLAGAGMTTGRHDSRIFLGRTIGVAVSVVALSIFPVPYRWTEIESISGVVPAAAAIPLAVGIDEKPRIAYSEGCCG